LAQLGRPGVVASPTLAYKTRALPRCPPNPLPWPSLPLEGHGSPFATLPPRAAASHLLPQPSLLASCLFLPSLCR